MVSIPLNLLPSHLKTKTLYKLVIGSLIVFLCSAPTVLAQQAPLVSRFKEGTLTGNRNITNNRLQKSTLLPARFAGKYFVVLQFDRLPDQEKEGTLGSEYPPV